MLRVDECKIADPIQRTTTASFFLVIKIHHCWKILLILLLSKVASKTQYSPLCNLQIVSIGFYSSLYIFYFTSINLTIFWPNFLVVLFNNVNTVRSDMWVLCFPHHSCRKRPSKSLVFDSWFERLFQHLWCGKHNTHMSSSQYSLIIHLILDYFNKHLLS